MSRLPRITERLLAAGGGEGERARIWGGNILRVLRTAAIVASAKAASAIGSGSPDDR